MRSWTGGSVVGLGTAGCTAGWPEAGPGARTSVRFGAFDVAGNFSGLSAPIAVRLPGGCGCAADGSADLGWLATLAIFVRAKAASRYPARMRNLTTLALLMAATAGLAAAPTYTIATQGRLLDPTDKPLNAAVQIKFSVYALPEDPTGQAPTPALWSATYTVNVTGGLYATELGDVSTGQPSLPANLFGSTDERWLGIAISGDPEMKPRLRLSWTPRALLAGNALALQGLAVADLDARYATLQVAAPGTAQSGSLAIDGTLTAGKLAGDGSAITNLPAAAVTGQMQDAQIAGLAASKLTGTVTDAQIAGLAASKLLGQVQDAQIAGLSRSKLTGTTTLTI